MNKNIGTFDEQPPFCVRATPVDRPYYRSVNSNQVYRGSDCNKAGISVSRLSDCPWGEEIILVMYE